METNMNRGMTESDQPIAMQNEMDSLKESFNKLRSDVADLFSHAFGFSKSGAFMARDYGADAMENVKSRFNDLKSRGNEQMHAVEHHVVEHPMKDMLIAFGVGFIMAKLMHHKD
jgi:ElaB/YqjD/DUF883 family membrane-anchored ribosome-binding protein